MKKGKTISSQLNKFNSIYNNLVAQEVEFPKLVKVLFLLITLPDSWDTFRTTINNSTPIGGLIIRNMTGSLLTEEVNRKNNKSSCNTLIVKGRSTKRGKKEDKSRSKSKTRHNLKDISLWQEGALEEELLSVSREWKRQEGKEEAQRQNQCKDWRGEFLEWRKW